MPTKKVMLENNHSQVLGHQEETSTKDHKLDSRNTKEEDSSDTMRKDLMEETENIGEDSTTVTDRMIVKVTTGETTGKTTSETLKSGIKDTKAASEETGIRDLKRIVVVVIKLLASLRLLRNMTIERS
jgi:hypothetical protein